VFDPAAIVESQAWLVANYGITGSYILTGGRIANIQPQKNSI
jgi:hypothetical protein